MKTRWIPRALFSLPIGWATLAAAPALALSGSADALKAKGYQPLAGSEWALAHPGELPYEQCAIKAGEISGSLYGVTATAGYGIGGMTGGAGFSESPQLLCWTKKLKLAFKIPVSIGGYRHVGASLAVSHLYPNRLRLSRLDGNVVGDLFSEYHGGEQAVIVAAGVGGMMLRNGTGIQLTSVSFRAGMGVVNGYTRLVIDARAGLNGSFRNECWKDEFLLMKGTESARSNDDCYERVTYDRSFAFFDLHDFSRPRPVDFETLSRYRFVKVGK